MLRICWQTPLLLPPPATPCLLFRVLDCSDSCDAGVVVAFCYVAMKPNGQKNDVRYEYTRGAPELLLLQIPIDIYCKLASRDYFCTCGSLRKMPQCSPLL